MTSPSTRDRILIALTSPRCPRELAEGLSLHVRGVQTAIRRMAEDNLVECITPDLTQARLYALTSLGKTKRYDLIRREMPHEPDIDWDIYAYIQSGSYRRRLLAVLSGPTTAYQLRKLLDQRGCGMQESHIHSTLADLNAMGVVTKKDRQGWTTTSAGSTMRYYMLDLITDQTASGPGHRGAGDPGAGHDGPAT